jgi:penicillin-binding protein 1C
MKREDQRLHEQPTQPVAFGRARTNRRGCSCLSRLFLLSVVALALVIFAGVVVAMTLIYVDLSGDIEEGIAALDSARDRETFETTRIHDRNGQLLWEIFGEGKRTRVPLSQIPQGLIDATVATEDDTFYENIGLDAPSLVAALVANLRNPEGRPVGGSTITQQLVKHLVFDYEERAAASYDRKTREVILAWIMNRRYSKDEILELYLNEIYYGNLAYGVEAAAQTYFGRSATELTLAETSLLAGLPQSPVELDPLQNLDGAKNRQWVVLNLMVSEGYISRAEAEAAYLTPLTFAPQEVSLEAPHFSVYVRQQLEQQLGPERVANGGLRVTTTLDMKYQRLAELLARQHVSAVGPEHNLTNAALIALKPGTGEILAMLGSLDYDDPAIDGNVNVTLSPQQPGSAIKPLTYAAALSPSADGREPAWTAADILWDVPVAYDQFDGTTYAPLNYDRRFHGPVRLRDALANSYNVPAVLVLQDIGVARLLDVAGQMGVATLGADAGRYGLALTLGGGEVTPLELTRAYGVFANAGYLIPSTAILRIENAAGEVLFEYERPEPAPVLDPRVAYLISHILDDDDARTPAMGRDNPLALPFPAAVKTGTTDDFRDNWTVGYTPGLVVGVWTGNTDNSAMVNISGLTGAAPLWSAYMQAVYGDYDLLEVLNDNGGQPPSDFIRPDGLEERPICQLASVVAEAEPCDLSDRELFLAAAPEATPSPTPDPEAVTWDRIDPAVWQIPAVPLPPLPPEQLISLDEEALPPQTYCYMPEGARFELLPPESAERLFLSPPRNAESFQPAHVWAAEHNLPILPAAPCDDELLALARDPNAPAVWRITSPHSGDRVSGVVPIVGTASFNPQEVHFYKLELGIGDPAEPEWVTLGEISEAPVVNGTLEMLHAGSLPPGEYLLRLIVVRWDGNYVGEPHTISLIFE